MPGLSPRHYAVSFGQDLSLFVAWSVIPVWAKAQAHASPAQLGALPVLGGVAYVLTSLFGGRLSDRVSRTTLARIGLAAFAVFCFLAWRAPSIGWVYAIAPISGFANAMIWPGLQALVGDESAAGELEGNLGRFSLSWSAGKTLGFFLGGLAWTELGLNTLAACGALSAVLVPLVPSRGAGHRAVAAPLVEEHGPPPQVRAAYLRAAWIANFGAYGLGATLNFLYEDLVISLGRPHTHYSNVLAVVFFAQTAAFWYFGRFPRWRYRPGAFLFWQAASAAALVVIGLGAPLAVALAAAFAAGVGLGLSYSASIYYSVHSDEARGARAGIHEAVIGASNFVTPMAGGVVQQAVGWSGTGYVMGAAIVAAAILIQLKVLSGARAGRG